MIGSSLSFERWKILYRSISGNFWSKVMGKFLASVENSRYEEFVTNLKNIGFFFEEWKNLEKRVTNSDKDKIEKYEKFKEILKEITKS